MGTTLENGVYLPSEGERNCYAGLKTNWEILDQKVADVTALQQAVAGALHREIVESLPTTDINPNTIYMILSGTSATENVYNEYMYVNNAWELIGTSATDLTNYYTKGDVDGLLLLKANASDLTSHTGDTTIHVTTADKNKWNNQTYVFRYSSTALVASSTNSNALLDNTDNLKVGDKVIDSSGVLFSITAIDTANSTFTIGTALIDLAQDSDVVHTSGNETVDGVKTITGSSLDFKSTSAEYGVSAGDSSVIFRDKNNRQTFKIYSRVFYSGIDNNLVSFFLTQKVDNTYYTSNGIQLLANTGNKDVILRPIPANNNADGLSVSLGASDRRWSKIYGIQYYYGSNNVEFSDKFVTTDTNQTISGNKTFNGSTTCVGELNQTAPFKMTADTSFITGSKNTSIYDQNGFQCANEQIVYNNSKNIRRAWSVNNNGSGTTVSAGFNLILSASGQKAFYPISDSDTDNGVSTSYWKNTYTKRLNGLEPSSLSLPSDRSARIDISSYFTNTGTGDTNTYTVPANGYIYMEINDCISLYMQSQTTSRFTNYGNSVCRNATGRVVGFLPVRKDDVFVSQWYTSATNVTLTSAFFIPCQGNV